ncbi:hypothetical protein D7B24_009009 [Verticillium nonalfalfae]|uniref:Peptidase S54 rhomboid domain-containing protein n=1 Tax=Verticillium nonalfalfae TaxID=1051616 RepID=A0A3M9Y427_9PEZI|nr:uncharacterized protein D7B24_009009 [Verticillium nonalfalfae]RNJ55064.1 hypothetical protein D7B24_009009 [Verticillium nonalfalfae]
MNVPFALLQRPLLQLGLRAICAQPSSRAATRLLSTCITSTKTTTTTTTHTRCLDGTAHGLPRFGSRVDTQWPSARTYATTRTIVIDRYEDLPDDYVDKDGLPFRTTELSSAEVKKIFGPRTKSVNANRLLRILHGRRVAGTLKDPAYSGNTFSFTKDEKLRAMAYLRKRVPVDEVLNEGLRAEDELRELEQEAAGEVMADGDGAAPPQTTQQHPRDQQPQPLRRKSDSVYGDSVFDNIRARNIAKREERERLEAEERAERERLHPGPLANLSDGPARPLSPQLQKWSDAATSNLEAPPEMTHVERLLPATTLVVLVVAALAGFAAVYTPPAQHDRLFPEVSLATATVATLIGLNALVFLAWRVPPLWRLMNRYFLLVHGLPRPASLVLASFSHSTFLTHFLPNMAALWVLGTLLHDDVGRAHLVALYVASGAAGFLGSLYWLTLRGHLLFSSLGASGAVYGLAGAYFWLHRFDHFKILGFPPAPLEGPQGLAFLGLIVGVHVFAFLRPKTTIDLMSHMAGMAVGILGASLARGAKQHGGAAAAAAAAAPAPASAASDMKRVDLVRDVRVTTTSAGDKGGGSA